MCKLVSDDPREVDAEASEAAAAIDSLEARLVYKFVDRGLLETALAHSSYAHENEGVESNERLEFLGDAVLGVLVAQNLFESHPDWNEGDLTRALASLVDRRSLARVGASHARVPPGAARRGARVPPRRAPADT